MLFFSVRTRHTRLVSDWSSDVCSSDLRKLVSPATSNVPVLLNVAPCPLHKSPPLKLVVPALLIVRCANPLALGPLNTRLPPPGITVVPLPFMFPPVQLSVPLTVNTPLPLRLPPLQAPPALVAF